MKTSIGLLITLLTLSATAKILVMDVADLRQMLSSPNRNMKQRSYRGICNQTGYALAGWVAPNGNVYISYKDSDGKKARVAEPCNDPVKIEGKRWRYKKEDLSLGECTLNDGTSIFGLIDIENSKLVEDDSKVCFMVREVAYERWSEEADF